MKLKWSSDHSLSLVLDIGFGISTEVVCSADEAAQWDVYSEMFTVRCLLWAVSATIFGQLWDWTQQLKHLNTECIIYGIQ